MYLMLTEKHLFYCSQCSEVGCQNRNIQSRSQMTHRNTKIQKFRLDKCKSCWDHLIDQSANISFNSGALKVRVTNTSTNIHFGYHKTHLNQNY